MGVRDLEHQKRQNDFNRKGSSIDKVPIKKIRISLARISIHGENVEDIIILTMRITTYSDARCGRSIVLGSLGRNEKLCEGGVGLKIVCARQQQASHVAFVDKLLVFEVFHSRLEMTSREN